MSGNLIVRPICAKLTRDTESFGSMDPYCIVCLGTEKQRSRVADGAGKFPNWQDQFVFRRTNQDQIIIQVWDKDSASSDDMVGEGNLVLNSILGSKSWEDWVEIRHRGRKAGDVRLNSH